MSCAQDIETATERAPDRGPELWRLGMLGLDQAAVALARVSDRLSLPLARLCREITAHEHWRRSGMRWPDFAREYGLGSRWIAELGFLGAKLDMLPELGSALAAGRVCRSAAVGIARVATPESVAAWLELAGTLNIRQLKERLKRARQAGSAFPVPDDAAPAGAEPAVLDDGDDAPQWIVRLPVPAAVRVAFDECHDLLSAVNGYETGTRTFVAMLLAETESGAERCESGAELCESGAPSPLHVRPETDTAAADRLDGSGRWRNLELEPARPAALELSRELLARVESFGEVRGPIEDDTEARALLIQLVAAERDALRVLGEVLNALAATRPFGRYGPCLPYLDFGHYAEARLGISRSLAYQLARVAREVRSYPRIKSGYDAGAIPVHSAALALRVLEGQADGEELDAAWAERLSCSTYKRLRDETAYLRRVRVADRDHVPAPLDDETWFRSIRREPGSTVTRLAHLAQQACCGRYECETLRLALPEQLARRFHGACAAREEKLRQQLQELGDEIASVQTFSDFPLVAVQTFSAFHPGSIEGWGLFALLWEFALTWDQPRRGWKSSSHEIYERRGYRCAAPTCSARVVEDSHVLPRGRGGSDALDNRDADCPYHHRKGIHGTLARRTGRAPLNTVWRLGIGDWRQWFRNELRIPDPEPDLIRLP